MLLKANLFRLGIATFLFLVVSATKASDHSPEQLRGWFQRAEQIAHKPNSSEYRFLKGKLKDYPLMPYVTQKTLLRYPYISNEKKIAQFLETYAGTPLDRPLRQKWLQHLKRQRRSDLFLKYFKDQNNVALSCQHLNYVIDKKAPTTQQLDEIEEYWLVGKSQPKECDPLFKIWENHNRRTDEKILKRVARSANGGNATLIPYLKRKLPDEKQYLADLWLSVRRSPSKIVRLSKFKGLYPDVETEILAYGVKRLIWRDTELALKTWPKIRKRFQFSKQQLNDVYAKFAIALAAKNHKKAEYWLQKASDSLDDPELYRWHLAQVLRSNDWHNVYSLLEQLPTSLEQEITYQYWRARGLENLGKKEQALSEYEQLAKKRHYYGFLASGKLKKDVSMSNLPLQYSDVDTHSFLSQSGAKRAYEFLQIGRKTSARREWYSLVPNLNDKQKQVAAFLADKWNWHDQAIHTFSDAGYLDDVEKRFPLPFKTEMLSSSKKNNVNPAWAFAITRRESSFKVDAYSGAGAHGLMQLLPGTVQYLEKKKIRRKKLYDPKYNVEMGTRYLSYLMERMDDNPVLATASYNAGWRRVKNWIPKDDAIPMDIWIETIPYKETRNYVKAVLAYKQIYQYLLGDDTNFFKQYAEMNIGEKKS